MLAPTILQPWDWKWLMNLFSCLKFNQSKESAWKGQFYSLCKIQISLVLCGRASLHPGWDTSAGTSTCWPLMGPHQAACVAARLCFTRSNWKPVQVCKITVIQSWTQMSREGVLFWKVTWGPTLFKVVQQWVKTIKLMNRLQRNWQIN